MHRTNAAVRARRRRAAALGAAGGAADPSSRAVARHGAAPSPMAAVAIATVLVTWQVWAGLPALRLR